MLFSLDLRRNEGCLCHTSHLSSQKTSLSFSRSKMRNAIWLQLVKFCQWKWGSFMNNSLNCCRYREQAIKKEMICNSVALWNHLINIRSLEKALLAVEYLNIKLNNHFENWQRKCGPIGSITWSTGHNHCDHTTEIIAITAKKSNTSQHSWDQANDSLCFKCELLKAGIRVQGWN